MARKRRKYSVAKKATFRKIQRRPRRRRRRNPMPISQRKGIRKRITKMGRKRRFVKGALRKRRRRKGQSMATLKVRPPQKSYHSILPNSYASIYASRLK